MLLGGVAIVPSIFVFVWDDVFSTPKLLALWVLLGVCVIGIALDGSASLRTFRFVRIVDTPVLVLVGIQTVAFGSSVDIAQSAFGERLQHQGYLTFLLYVGYFFVARMSMTTTARVRLLFTAVTGGASLVAIYAIAQRLGLDPIWATLPDDRVFSTIGQPNALGAFFVLTVPLTVTLGLIERSARARAAASASGVAQLLAMTFTASRGAVLGMALVVILLTPTAWRWGRQHRRKAAIAFSLGIAVMGAVLLGPARDASVLLLNRASASFETTSPGSVRMHIDLWNVAAQIARDNAALGTGPDTYAVVFPEYRDRVLPGERAAAFAPFRVESPHNVVLATAVGAGIPAALTYIWIPVAVSWLLFRKVPRRADPTERLMRVAIFAAIVGHLVTDLFMTAEVTSSWLFWILMGTGVSLARAEPCLRNGRALEDLAAQ